MWSVAANHCGVGGLVAVVLRDGDEASGGAAALMEA